MSKEFREMSSSLPQAESSIVSTLYRMEGETTETNERTSTTNDGETYQQSLHRSEQSQTMRTDIRIGNERLDTATYETVRNDLVSKNRSPELVDAAFQALNQNERFLTTKALTDKLVQHLSLYDSTRSFLERGIQPSEKLNEKRLVTSSDYQTSQNALSVHRVDIGRLDNESRAETAKQLSAEAVAVVMERHEDKLVLNNVTSNETAKYLDHLTALLEKERDSGNVQNIRDIGYMLGFRDDAWTNATHNELKQQVENNIRSEMARPQFLNREKVVMRLQNVNALSNRTLPTMMIVGTKSRLEQAAETSSLTSQASEALFGFQSRDALSEARSSAGIPPEAFTHVLLPSHMRSFESHLNIPENVEVKFVGTKPIDTTFNAFNQKLEVKGVPAPDYEQALTEIMNANPEDQIFTHITRAMKN